MSDSKELIKKIISEVERISEELALEPYQLTKAKFLRLCASEITGRQLERLGGFKTLVLDHFGGDQDKDLGVIEGHKQKKRYLQKLESLVGSYEYKYKVVSDIVTTKLSQFKFPAKSKVTKPKLVAEEREIVALISDTHFGIEIDDRELGGVNKYNWQIAARRMGLFAEQIATFKHDQRSKTPVLRLCLGGDLAQGIIHLSEANTDLISHQVIGTTHILYQLIDYLRNFFEKICIECTTDNHMRMVHKGGSRATSQKFDSYATFIHHALSMGFHGCKDVEFNIPKTPYTVFEVLGNKFYLTHGDTLINVGMPGRKIHTDHITNAANRLNASLKDKEEYKVILVGHVHTPVFITLDNGTELVINGTGSGLDPYAQSIGIFESNPVQVIFESTSDFPVGDQRKVFLKKADNDPKYEKIIEPYKYDLHPTFPKNKNKKSKRL